MSIKDVKGPNTYWEGGGGNNKGKKEEKKVKNSAEQESVGTVDMF